MQSKNLIYQFWNGTMPHYALRSSELMQRYANCVGADYKLSFNEHFFSWITNPFTRRYEQYFNALRPIYDPWFAQYESVLFVDMDVYPGVLQEDIFSLEVYSDFDIAMAEEAEQPDQRIYRRGPINSVNDKKYAEVIERRFQASPPKMPDGRLKIFNSGVVLYRNLRSLRAYVPKPDNYIASIKLAGLPRFYCLDQNFLGAIIGTSKVRFFPLDEAWNFRVRNGADPSTEYNFLHLQLTGKESWSKQTTEQIIQKLPLANFN